MSLVCCDKCGCIVDTDMGDAYTQAYEDGNEDNLNEARCQSCQWDVAEQKANRDKNE